MKIEILADHLRKVVPPRRHCDQLVQLAFIQKNLPARAGLLAARLDGARELAKKSFRLLELDPIAMFLLGHRCRPQSARGCRRDPTPRCR
jgi:hypothetical protein